MEQIQRIIMPNGTIIGVDFGSGNDVCVKTIIKRDLDGVIRILSQEVFGKAKDFVDDKDRIKYIDNIKNK